MPTMQETFDTVVAHLRKQGKKSLGSDGKCAYRGKFGRMCAAGCLIPDRLYSRSLENTSVSFMRSNPVTELFKKLGHDISLVMALQYVHDNNHARTWEKKLAGVAARFKLRLASLPTEGLTQ